MRDTGKKAQRAEGAHLLQVWMAFAGEGGHGGDSRRAGGGAETHAGPKQGPEEARFGWSTPQSQGGRVPLHFQAHGDSGRGPMRVKALHFPMAPRCSLSPHRTDGLATLAPVDPAPALVAKTPAPWPS